MRDQVGSYRVIVSYETPELEAFSLCILQQTQPPRPALRRVEGGGVTVDQTLLVPNHCQGCFQY